MIAVETDQQESIADLAAITPKLSKQPTTTENLIHQAGECSKTWPRTQETRRVYREHLPKVGLDSVSIGQTEHPKIRLLRPGIISLYQSSAFLEGLTIKKLKLPAVR